MGDTGRDLTGIAMALVGVAFAALLIGHSKNTVQIIGQSAESFNSLLQTVSLQGNSGGGYSSLNSMNVPGV